MSQDDRTQTYRLLTYNIGGGRQQAASDMAAVRTVIREAAPDVVALQEVTCIQDAAGNWYSDLEAIQEALGESFAAFYTPSVTLSQHLHIGKTAMLEALFRDDRDWQQGNALLSRWPFHRLGERSLPGEARRVPLFRPTQYLGSRDTEPRNAIVARLGRPPFYPLVIATHLTTLSGERGTDELPGRSAEARRLRAEQARQLVGLLAAARRRDEVVFLLGDFNAAADEESIRQVLVGQGEFLHLRPAQANIGTHPKVPTPIDHIFVYPASRLVDYRCHIIDSDLAQRASDHLPVLAEVTLRG
ncbi:MAG: endonuclease/exonuclease/phosphatase family protein [Anaerolineae bacterium]